MDTKLGSERRLRVVDCAGSPRERGRAHGEALRPVIGEGLGRWLASLGLTHGSDPDSYLREFLTETEYLAAIERWTPDLLDEVRGIAEGADQPFDRILAYNLLDEEWAYAAGRRESAPGCSVVCFHREDGVPILGQTMDIPALHDGTQTVLRFGPTDRPEALIFTYAGMIGLNGCSANGLGAVVNNLVVLPSSVHGLPVAFVLRGLLAQPALGAAVAFVQRVPHATGQHYALGDGERLVSLECSARGVLAGPMADGRILHTNHPLASQELPGDPERSYTLSRTRERYAYLRERGPGVVDRIGVERLLSDTSVPISLAPDRPVMTFGAVSIELTAPPRFRVTPGPPHSTPFVDIPFSTGRRAVAA